MNRPLSRSLRNAATLRKGLLWQQRDKMFSRWKERFFILTSNYLQCFKKGTSRITEMGGFIFKLRLSEVRTAQSARTTLHTFVHMHAGQFKKRSM